VLIRKRQNCHRQNRFLWQHDNLFQMELWAPGFSSRSPSLFFLSLVPKSKLANDILPTNLKPVDTFPFRPGVCM
jgi:hypothetical protein